MLYQFQMYNKVIQWMYTYMCVYICVYIYMHIHVSVYMRVLSCSVMSDALRCMHCSPPGSSVHGIFQQEYWSGLPFPPPGDLPNPETEPASLASPALVGGFYH